MAARRGRGEGGLFRDEGRQRYIAEITTGYTPAGKRIVRRGSGKTITEARAKLKEVMRDRDDGLPTVSAHTTVADIVTDWLTFGLGSATTATRQNYTILATTHIIAHLGRRKLPDLSATDVDRWLADRATQVSTRTLRLLHSILNRATKRAMARDKVKRNLVDLCTIPEGKPGRPSKSLTLAQTKALLAAAEASWMRAYIVVSLLTGARTEELRALTWDHVDLDGQADTDPPVPASIEVWHSVRIDGDTKTRKSRRTLALPQRCIDALDAHKAQQEADRAKAGKAWQPTRLVFTTGIGTALDHHNVRRAFRSVATAAGLTAKDWTPRELRHSFVSLLSDNGVSIEDIADLCGHSGTAITETVYRHQLRPVLLDGAVAMDKIFAA